MIKFGYLDGYSSYNVPKFNGASARNNNFDNYVLYSIDAYYPPYFTNIIKVDISEVPQTAPINFVILVYNSKYYYYFIDHFNYINEDIYEIIINMDTVLTYMFDYKVSNCTITRESISRWIVAGPTEEDWIINRNYIRENVSEGFMEVSSNKYLSPNKYLIVASTYNFVDNSEYPSRYRDSNNTIYSIGYYIYVFPLAPFQMGSTSYVSFYDDNKNHYRGGYRYDLNVTTKFIDEPYTVYMGITESSYLDNILGTTWSGDSTTAKLAVNPIIYDTQIVRYDGSNKMGFLLTGINIDNNLVKTEKVYHFVPNTQELVNFNKHFIPQLLDENYIQVEYGDINGFASYPLHNADNPLFDYYNNLDVTNGNDGYLIMCHNWVEDRYKTYTISLGLSFDLISDKWLEYQSLNKGTLSTGLQLQMVNTLYSGAKNIAMPTANRLFNQTRSLQYFEQGRDGLSDMYANQSFRNQQQQLTGLSDTLMQAINVVGNYQATRENMEYAPDTVKGRANIFSMLFSKYKKPYIRKYVVNDIDNCAKKLEEYGYKVNRVSNILSYIQDLCINRTLYNCVSAKVYAYKTLCFIPSDIINDINDRLENGLRFINMNKIIQHNLNINDIFKYDNVEIDLI